MGAVVTPAAQREFAFNRSDFEKVRKTLMSQAGIRLADSQDGMVYSRLARRLRALNMDSLHHSPWCAGTHPLMLDYLACS